MYLKSASSQIFVKRNSWIKIRNSRGKSKNVEQRLKTKFRNILPPRDADSAIDELEVRLSSRRSNLEESKNKFCIKNNTPRPWKVGKANPVLTMASSPFVRTDQGKRKEPSFKTAEA